MIIILSSVISSFEECPLFVSPFSEPVEGYFSKKEMELIREYQNVPEAKYGEGFLEEKLGKREAKEFLEKLRIGE